MSIGYSSTGRRVRVLKPKKDKHSLKVSDLVNPWFTTQNAQGRVIARDEPGIVADVSKSTGRVQVIWAGGGDGWYTASDSLLKKS